MEMMVVLLIISIVAAASAPMISKKLARNAEQSDNPWVYPNLGDSVAFNMRGDKNVSAMIGTATLPIFGNNLKPKLYIESNGDEPQLSFGNKDANNVTHSELVVDTRAYNSISNQGARVGISNASMPAGTIAFGTNQTIDGSSKKCVVIGSDAAAEGGSSVVIGSGAKAGSEDSVAINGQAYYEETSDEGEVTVKDTAKTVAIGGNAQSPRSTAIGVGTVAKGEKVHKHGSHYIDYPAVAIGSTAVIRHSNTFNYTYATRADARNTVALGIGAYAHHNNSVVIGVAHSDRQSARNELLQSTAENQVVLGTAADTVYIPGNIVVMGNVLLGGNGSSRVYLNASDGTGNGIVRLTSGASDPYISTSSSTDGFLRGANSYTGETSTTNAGSGITSNGIGIGNTVLRDGNGDIWFTSDRRLKNVGEKYKAGLAELKKLDLYNYTFKKDDQKTPQVGVMAQDLQKIFPNAVREGEDGYLRIRWDEMFYAVINAVKELDEKITAVVEQVKAFSDKVAQLEQKITAQQETISEQQKAITELQKQNAEFDKRLKKLESKK